jgi:hypothetical protein
VVATAPVVDDTASDLLVTSWFALLAKYEVIVRFADLFRFLKCTSYHCFIRLNNTLFTIKI